MKFRYQNRDKNNNRTRTIRNENNVTFKKTFGKMPIENNGRFLVIFYAELPRPL